MEKISINKNSWKLYLSKFGKLFFFSLSVILSFAVCVAIFLVFGDFWFLSILGFAFGVIPLFYCLQIACVKVASGKEIEYNEFYQPYKTYFSANRGCYKMIRNTILTFLIFYLSIYLSIFLYDLFNYGVLNSILDEYYSLEMTTNDYNNLINEIFNMKGFIYYLVLTLMLPFLFFFNRVKKKLLVPYFNLLLPMPNMVTQSVTKKIYKDYKKEINKHTLAGNLLFLFVFVVGYTITSIITTLLLQNTDNSFSVALVILVSMFVGLLLTCFVLPPVLLNYCFAADLLHMEYIKGLKTELTSLIATSKLSGNEETKELLETLINSLDINENVTVDIDEDREDDDIDE